MIELPHLQRNLRSVLVVDDRSPDGTGEIAEAMWVARAELRHRDRGDERRPRAAARQVHRDQVCRLTHCVHGGRHRTAHLAGEYAPESWPVSLDGWIGHEDGAFGDGKLDWAAGVTKPFGPVSLSLHYVDSDGPGADSALVAGIKAGF